MLKKMNFSNRKIIHCILAAILSLIVYSIVPDKQFPEAPKMAAIVVLMAYFWIFEVVPIAITSLFPIFLFPLFGILNVKSTALFFGKEIIFLFLGGLMLAQGIQQSNLHKRIALHIINLIGSKPSNLVLGFMVATGFLSMWISNTASVMVMMPIALSIIEEISTIKNDKKFLSKLAVSIMLGIAYAADIGGMATLIGTPPNMVFIDMYNDFFPNLSKIGFTQWMFIGLPISIIFTFLGWLLMTKVIFRIPNVKLFESSSIIDNQIKLLGNWNRDEIVAGIVFLTAVLLWLTGSDIALSEDFTIYGWRSIEKFKLVSDASIAIGTATFLFLIPSKIRPNEMILKWEIIHKLPWGILLLFGGGFAIAGGFTSSGLSEIVGNLFTKISVDSPLIIVLVICISLTFLTEITSNTATTNLVLPILAKASAILGMDPRLLMIPATLSASCAFMMPIASPTQAIVFGSGHVQLKQMIRAGIFFNILGIIVITGMFFLLSRFL